MQEGLGAPCSGRINEFTQQLTQAYMKRSLPGQKKAVLTYALDLILLSKLSGPTPGAQSDFQ